MKLILTGRQSLKLQQNSGPELISENEIILDVLCCAVCRTDAKMWKQGHRDLILPRVPGHEIAAANTRGHRFVIWPGNSCGKCSQCLSGRENLCAHMQILGFHKDGGFASKIAALPENLIAIPESLSSPVACFAEPLGCIFNAIKTIELKSKPGVIIYGGGTMGLLAALVIKKSGGRPVVIEKNPEKKTAAQKFLWGTEIPYVNKSNENNFDAAINACADPGAFCRALKNLKKGGQYIFFSGIDKNTTIDTSILNLIHYHEISVCGAYGLRKKDMEKAVTFLNTHAYAVEKLICKVIAPKQAPDIMETVLSGKGFRYILDFR